MIWCLGCCIRQSEQPVSFLEVLLSIFIVDPERMNSGVRGKQEAAGSRRERIDQVAHQSSSTGWWRCRQSPVVSLVVHWITSRNISEINVSFKRQRKETSCKDKEGKWFRLLIKCFTLFHVVGTEVMHRSLRNLDVRVRGTSRSDAWSRDRHWSCDHATTVFYSGLIMDFGSIHLTFYG